ncbi:YciI family protein [Candidatus Binatia bacterium]|nr:YciI family protein [Candidatus Binatia bacterium]
MKYLCLAYYDEKKFETLTEADMAAIGRDCRPHDEELQRSGHLLEVASLAATKDSVSLRPRGGKVTVTDGPYAETKEQLGSFFLIEARDLNEAIQVASLHPAARLNEQLGWGIEIRPIETCRVVAAR